MFCLSSFSSLHSSIINHFNLSLAFFLSSSSSSILSRWSHCTFLLVFFSIYIHFICCLLTCCCCTSASSSSSSAPSLFAIYTFNHKGVYLKKFVLFCQRCVLIFLNIGSIFNQLRPPSQPFTSPSSSFVHSLICAVCANKRLVLIIQTFLFPHNIKVELIFAC